MPDLTNEQLTIALAIVAVVALLCVLFVLLLAARLRKARREYMSLRGEDGEERDILSAMGRTIKRVQTLDGRIAELSAAHKAHTALSRASMQKFALVRYDAFEDMGGQLSFSAARRPWRRTRDHLDQWPHRDSHLRQADQGPGIGTQSVRRGARGDRSGRLRGRPGRSSAGSRPVSLTPRVP